MSSDLELQLRAEMERFAAPMRLPRGLAVRAYRRQRRRRITTWTTAAAGTAALAGSVTMITASATPATRIPGHTSGQHAQTAAYLAHRIGTALHAATAANDILYIHATDNTSKDWFYRRGSRPWARIDQEWVHRYGEIGISHHWTEGEIIARQGKIVSITVDFATKTWYREESKLLHLRHRHPLKLPSPTTSSCRQFVALYMGETPTQLEAGIREALRCGQLLMAGTEQVEGVSTIKLVPSRARMRGTGMKSPVTLWVNSSNYLPVRWRSDGRYAPHTVYDIEWLPPTPANLARLTVNPPPGFRYASGPPPEAGPKIIHRTGR